MSLVQGMPWSAAHHRGRRLKAADPPGKRDINVYSLETYGLDAAAVAEDYAACFQAFDVPRESATKGRTA